MSRHSFFDVGLINYRNLSSNVTRRRATQSTQIDKQDAARQKQKGGGALRAPCPPEDLGIASGSKCVVSGFEALACLNWLGARGSLAGERIEKAQCRVGAPGLNILKFHPGHAEERGRTYLLH